MEINGQLTDFEAQIVSQITDFEPQLLDKSVMKKHECTPWLIFGVEMPLILVSILLIL